MTQRNLFALQNSTTIFARSLLRFCLSEFIYCFLIGFSEVEYVSPLKNTRRPHVQELCWKVEVPHRRNPISHRRDYAVRGRTAR